MGNAKTSENALELRNVSLTVGSKNILNDISFSLQTGSYCCVMGANGAGKSSLVSIISGRKNLTKGEARVLGRRIGFFDVRELHKEISIVSSGMENLIRTNLSVEEIVLAGKDGSAAPFWQTFSKKDRDKARELLDQVGLEYVRFGHRFENLSSGERRRTLFARSLMIDPRLVVLDEPMSGLDLKGREILLQAVTNMVKAMPQVTFLHVVHQLETIPSVASHVLFLKGGELIGCGKIEDTLNAQSLKKCFDIDIQVKKIEGRYYGRAVLEL